MMTNLKVKCWGKITATIMEFNTLLAMAKVHSGECHKYSPQRTSEHRVLITYSNPDEHAYDHPVTMYVPCFKSKDVWWVVLLPTKFEGVTDDIHDPFQLFEGFLLSKEQDPNEVLTEQEIKRGWI